MARLLRRLGIGARIWIAVLIPVAGMLAFSIHGVAGKYEDVQRMRSFRELTALAPVIGASVHELQKERGMSVGFIGSRGAKFGDRIGAQRALSDGRLRTLTGALSRFETQPAAAPLAGQIAQTRSALARLADERAAVDHLAQSQPQVAGYYTGLIGGLLSMVEQLAVMDNDARLSKAITAYTQLLQGKERAGQERAVGAGGFGAGRFETAAYRHFIALIAQQNAYFATFRAYAAPDERQALAQALASPAALAVDRMSQIAYDSPFTGNTGHVDTAVWFDTITRKIDLLKGVEDKVAGNLGDLAAAIQAGAWHAFLWTLGAMALLFALALSVAWAIAADISRPLGRVIAGMKDLSAGDYGHGTDGADRQDQIGDMARAVETFRQGLIRAEDLARQQQSERDAKDRRARVIDSLLQTFNSEVADELGSMAEAARQMEATSRTMSATADQTAGQATAVAAAVEEMSANMHVVSSAADQLVAAVDRINSRVTDSAQIAETARVRAQETNSLFEGLTQAVGRISDVVGLINHIASQTNLLALNATIEAARAGDAGKGFAVVAGEVKTLANQTAQATDEISAQINAVQNETHAAVEAIADITGIIHRMSDFSTGILQAVSEQDVATSEISDNVHQVSQGADEVTANVSGVRNAAGETGRAAGNVLAVARDVAERTENLRRQIDAFLSNIRAA